MIGAARIVVSTAALLAFLAASAIPTTFANPEPRPPGAPKPLNLNNLASLSLTPQQALDAETIASDAAVSNSLGPHANPPRPNDSASQWGKIQIVSTDSSSSTQWLGDGSLDGSGVYANTTDQPGTVNFPATTCSTLPPLFSIYGILAEYAALPYVGLASFTGLPNAPSSLSSTSGGYAFVAPVNQTNSKTFAQSESSLGSPYRGESAVWSLDCITQELTASWTLSDGSSLPVSFVSWSKSGLIATGNYAAFKQAFPTAEAPLKFVFVPAANGSTTFWDAQTAQDKAAAATTAAARTTRSTRSARPTRTPRVRTTTSAVPSIAKQVGQNVQGIAAASQRLGPLSSASPIPSSSPGAKSGIKHRRHQH
ncbi:BZ3500_MvSof-1268-A1-R1_Chr8-1g09944 [Microbotryum saponariae]|uniref:BZ3500_MvSof-1268-A1-R1_Chr8-1g09944 protein n=1 Tax=Microbotryum saponariae TaxID=289078 RepID=A0A2X0MNX3_9BASI|nr:BZ3500_MvSof-1268-A1-R1_Chr8-1g09944 [Microbotryum saponariae]SDA08230.1 BZ3501_MvSof-1269-A2-R1_Chr8-1g09667 [Microbotryum saponariae]